MLFGGSLHGHLSKRMCVVIEDAEEDVEKVNVIQ
jgi:hypothetical protein